jgi:hypothetical protein
MERPMTRSMKWTTTHFPTELWVLVLDSVGFSDLKAISLTCRRFRSLAIPRLFCRLFLGAPSKSWYWRKPSPSGFFLVNSKDIKVSDVGPLLAFYGSEHIAPLVREFRTAYADFYYRRKPSIEVMMLDLLHRLPNVQSVGFEGTDVTQPIMQTISQLPALASITMDNCVYDDLEGPLLRLKNVSLFVNYPSGVKSNWPFTVQPELLESLHVDSFTFPNFSSLPNLRTLHVHGDGKAAAPVIRCLDFLTKCDCPSLDTLILPRCRFVHGELAAFDRSILPTIPCLKVYHGPSVLSPLLAAGSSLHSASLSGTTRPDDPTPEDTADSLDKLHALAPNLVVLTIDVVCPSEAIARAILQFRVLEELYLKTRNRELGPMKASIIIAS